MADKLVVVSVPEGTQLIRKYTAPVFPRGTTISLADVPSFDAAIAQQAKNDSNFRWLKWKSDSIVLRTVETQSARREYDDKDVILFDELIQLHKLHCPHCHSIQQVQHEIEDYEGHTSLIAEKVKDLCAECRLVARLQYYKLGNNFTLSQIRWHFAHWLHKLARRDLNDQCNMRLAYDASEQRAVQIHIQHQTSSLQKKYPSLGGWGYLSPYGFFNNESRCLCDFDGNIISRW